MASTQTWVTAFAASLSSLATGCSEMTTSTIPPRELPCLSADRAGSRSVWTTDGKVVDVTEPFAVEVRTHRRAAADLRIPGHVVLDGPLLARVDGGSLTVQGCRRLGAAGDERCRPDAVKIEVPLQAISEVSVHTRGAPKDDPRAGPGSSAQNIWVLPVVLGGIAAFVGVAYSLDYAKQHAHWY